MPTARKYTSLYNHAKMVDYHIKCGVPATVDIIIYSDSPVTSDIVIPVNTKFTSNDNKPWVSAKEVVLLSGTQSVKVALIQKESIPTKVSLGRITSQDVSLYLGTLPSDRKYVEGSMVLTIGGEPWKLVDTFAYSGPNDMVYKVEPDSQLKPRIIFGDGQFGKKPNLNSYVEVTYELTYGSQGNVPSGSFTTVPSPISEKSDELKISSPSSANGGSDYEDFDMVKAHLPLSVKSLGVAITKDDYEAITMLVPGVNKAYVNYRCGRYVEVYITPDNPSTDSSDTGWGQASTALIDKVTQVLNKSKVITTNIVVGSTHAAKIYLEADITGKKSFTSTEISSQVKKVLLEAYNYNTSDINKPVRLSDLYSLIDNVPLVDYLQIKNLSLLAYPIPKSANQAELVITSFKQTKFFSDEESQYEKLELTFISGTNFTIRGLGKVVTGRLGQNVTVVTSKTTFSITIGSNSIAYNTGDTYDLYISRINSDLIPQNYNIPIFSENSIQLTIHEVV